MWKWGLTLDFPIVPVAGVVDPLTGKVVVWSAYEKDQFEGSPGGWTLTSTLAPTRGEVAERNVTNIGHDMFCPGLSLDANGRVVVTGGNNAQKTSFYDSTSGGWGPGPDMKVPRGYQSSATCSDGRVFTIGGPWSGGEFEKNGEVYDPRSNSWTMLPSATMKPMLTADREGIYRADNHGWLFVWRTVFQAGLSTAMNWCYTSGTGDVQPAGQRKTASESVDPDSMCGNAVMFDAARGKILVEPWRSPSPLTPELYDPPQNTFVDQVPNSIVRVYRSIALLLPDATVLSGGGGLCGTCDTNHFDEQTFSLRCLFDGSGNPATRPVIRGVSSQEVSVGTNITVTTDGPVRDAALMQYGSSTHTVNSDQRRVPLTLKSNGGNSYTASMPGDLEVHLPGDWVLFVMNENGVPSLVVRSKCCSGDIDDVLTYILLSIAISGSDFKSDCSKWWSKAVRLAITLRLNREEAQCSATVVPCADPVCSCHRRPIDESILGVERQEERRRVFWLLYSLDRHLSLSFNTVLSIPDSYCAVYDLVWENLDTIARTEMPARAITGRSPSRTHQRSTSGSPAHSEDDCAPRDNASNQSRAQLVIAYSTHILHVLHILLYGKWDAIAMLEDDDGWITSERFPQCTSHAIAASQSLSTILVIDPELAFMSYLFGIYLLQGSFIFLLFADRLPQLGPNESVQQACENIIRAHEVCVVTLSTEFQVCRVTERG
ncbi:flagellar fliJ protein domain-containing protein [Purpureocillium lavendulum]|uniref:Flagellar fliJ protein domain-containing protein n=1 Tax=Purpureocillium lavendulum TaxID=1247861 RepID=A0AB34FDW9_9HYPO|nr:flagellar fliJ protein domain-containing protein [Purpureocillium lavendulum]